MKDEMRLHGALRCSRSSSQCASSEVESRIVKTRDPSDGVLEITVPGKASVLWESVEEKVNKPPNRGSNSRLRDIIVRTSVALHCICRLYWVSGLILYNASSLMTTLLY